MPRVEQSPSQHDPWHRRAVSLRFARAFAISVSAMGCFATAAALPHGLTSATSEQPVKKANIIVQLDEQGKEVPNSRPGPITEVGPKIGLSPAQIRRIRKTEGDIWCVDESDRPVIRASAQLLLQNVVITTAHFAEEDDGTPQKFVAACYFRNKSGDRRVAVKLDESHVKFYTRNIRDESGKDLLLIRLDTSIPGAEPFPIDIEVRPLASSGEPVVAVTAHSEGLLEHPEQNIVQQCHTFVHLPADGTSLNLELLDCTAVHQNSGGTILSRPRGDLQLCAIIIRSGDSEKDGYPFSLADRSFTIAIKIDDQIVRDAIALSHSGRAR